jgi:hypothetical protein
MLLLANGCSHTAGAEIEYLLQGYCYEKAYPKHTAELLGWDYENIANSGASQERIIRTTVNWVGKNYKRYKNKEIYLVIMWSGPSRTELYDDRIHKYLQIVPNNDIVYKQQFTNTQYVYYKSYVAVQNRYAQMIKWYNNVILMQNYLANLGINYLFLNATETLPVSNPSNSDKFLHLAAQINYKKYPWATMPENSYFNILKKQGFKSPLHAPGGGHLGEDGHKYYGEYLAKYIKENL